MAASTISMCQSSIHSFISSIPSQASEIAVNAVNSFIEDQVGDPIKFERNISRVKSVFSRCHCGLGRFDGGGDCPNPDLKCLLTIPRKARQTIWKYLDDNSVKTLRLVCHQLKHEMDFDVGLSVVLTTASFHDPWIKSIAIRSCIINEIDTMILLNNLARPETLEKLCFAPELEIEPDMIELTIRKFRNLRQLIIFTEDVAELKNAGEEAVSTGTSSRLITRLEDQFQLTSIDVKFDTRKWKLKWNIKLKPQSLDNYWEIHDVTGPFGMTGIARVPRGRDLSRKSLKTVTLSIPFVQDRDRYIWLRVLQTQNVLSSLTCDLNATHWREYEKIIRANNKSIQKVFLLNITCAACINWKAAPFDWKVLGGCLALEEITLIADTFIRSSGSTISIKSRRYIESVNMHCLQSCTALRALWLENFMLTQDDMSFLKPSDSEDNENARFELCTLKNCMIDSEEVSESHVGRKKGRNRNLECLCFGTTSYDDDDLENFEKHTAASWPLGESSLETDLDMIDCFKNTCEGFQRNNNNNEQSDKVLESFNLIAGCAFTVWLYFC